MSNEEPQIRYEIRVEGVLGARWSTWFEGMHLRTNADRTTTIVGPVSHGHRRLVWNRSGSRRTTGRRWPRRVWGGPGANALDALVAEHPRVRPIVLDVTDGASIDDASQQVGTGTAGHGLDVRVNVAGTLVLGPGVAVSQGARAAREALVEGRPR